MRTRKTIKAALCQMCTRLCGMSVYIEADRITKIEGMPEHPLSKGGLCPKGLAAAQYEYDPRRLTQPLRRVGKRGEGNWEHISWTQAIDITADNLLRIKENSGAEAIVFYTIHNLPFVMRFMNLLGSPNIASHSHLCSIPAIMGQVYTMGSLALPDIERTNCILLWGSNPFATTIANFGRRLLDAKQRGVKLVVIDPRFSATASKADLFVRLRPGTDGALALGMLNVILEERIFNQDFITEWTYGFDEFSDFLQQYHLKKVEDITGVPAATVRELARIYATGKPACIGVGNGIDQHANSVQTSRAIAILMAVTGNVDQPGGNVFPVRPPLADVTLAHKLPPQVRGIDRHPLYYRIWRVPGSDMVDVLLSAKPYPLKAMIVMAGDPAVSLSNTARVREALDNLEFLVVHDLFMTATAELADIVLPAASWLESSQISSYAFSTIATTPLDTQLLALHRKVVDPPGQCHSDLDFVFDLAKKLGYGEYFPWRSVEDAFEEQLKPSGVTIDDLKAHPSGIVKITEPHDLYLKYEKHGFNTPTKKVELYSKVFEQFGYDPLPTFEKCVEYSIGQSELSEEYPFTCGAAIKPVLYTQNQFRTVPWLREIMPEAWVEIHHQKAKEIGIKDGELVVVESPRGSIKVKAKLVKEIEADTLFISHGWGEPYASGQADNNITPDFPRCPLSGSTPNRSFLCRLKRA